eukprot:15360140-Ditylum_brightwellii.AAC.1
MPGCHHSTQFFKQGLQATEEICMCYEEYEPAMPVMLVTACKHPSEREGKNKVKHKVEESYHNWRQAPQ